ncbi:MAG: hypothetical protein IMZ44_07610 [Planctomycetes bacterium]|nr:hypothetical protein [Planctomycetota bacterium]
MTDSGKCPYCADALRVVWPAVPGVPPKVIHHEIGGVACLERRLKAKCKENAALKADVERLTAQIDLNRDEFLRIKACPGADSEIKQLCDRSQSVIAQHTPVLAQRDNAVARSTALEAEAGRLRVALEPFAGLYPGWMDGWPGSRTLHVAFEARRAENTVTVDELRTAAEVAREPAP